MASLLPPLIQTLRGDSTQLIATYKEVSASADTMAASTEAAGTRMVSQNTQVGASAAKLGSGVLLGSAAILGLSTAAAVAAQTVDAKLSVAVKNAGGNFDALKPKIDAADASNRKFGYTNDETNTALASLTTALGSPKKALADLSIAADLARTKNIDLSAAALLVAKTSEGQTKGLKQLGIDLPVAASNAAQVAAAQTKLAAAQDKANSILAATPGAANAASKAHKAYETAVTAVASAQANLKAKQDVGGIALAALTAKVKGAGDAYGKTLKGQLASTGAQFEALGEQIGAKIIPILSSALKTATDFFDFLSKNKPVAIALGVAVGVIATALAAYSIATKIAAAAQLLFNVALDANPIGIIILAIGALIAIIVLVATHWKQISKFLMDSWKNIASFFVSVGKSISNWWTGFWNSIVNFAIAIFKGYVNVYVTIFKSVYNFFVSIGSDITKWWNGFWSGLFDWVTTQWNQGIKVWTAAFQLVYTGLVSIGTNITKWWNGLWNGVVSFVQGVRKGAANGVIGFINTMIDAINGLLGGINQVLSGIKVISGGAINLHIGKIPHIPSFDIGTSGVPGPVGAPVLAVVHGGEPVLSNAMMAGNAPIPQNVVNAVNNQQGSAGGKTVTQNNYITTTANPTALLQQMGWITRQLG